MLLRQSREKEIEEKSPLRLPKIRARVLDRHKRLYLMSTGRTYTLFILSVVSVCNHNKSH